MRVCARLFALMLVGFLATSPAAFGQTVVEVASKWGLLGTWRLDCRKPPSARNLNLRYVVRGQRLFQEREFGDHGDSNPVVSASTKADGSLEIVIDLAAISQTRELGLIKGNGGRIRAISNRNVNTNEFTISKGRFTASGDPTPWETRCQ
jgi:hypothetical protein